MQSRGKFPKDSPSKDLDINFKLGQFPPKSHFYLAVMFPVANWGMQKKKKKRKKIGEEKREINRA